MGIKRFIYNRLFNKRQREVIWKAVLYSEYKYKQRGNVNGAAAVRTTINEVYKTAATKQPMFSASQVHEIVQAEVAAARSDMDDKMKKAYVAGRKEGFKQALSQADKLIDEKISNYFGKKDAGECENDKLKEGVEIDLEKCEKCTHKDECILRAAILELNEESSKENEETDKTEEREIPVEGDDAEKKDAAEDSEEAAPADNKE